MDCATDTYGGVLACEGGRVNYCFDYFTHDVYTAGPKVALESDYPYQGKISMCKYDGSGPVNVFGLNKVRPNSANDLIQAVTYQPVPVAIDGKSYMFKTYKEGVITSPDCLYRLTHAVLAVGYGTENGQDYFLLKNSWGTNWGENGYVKIGISNDAYGICGILSDPGPYPYTN